LVVSDLTVWQLQGQTTTAINSYVIITRNQNIIVMDGGLTSDAKYLHKVLRDKCGNHVTAWFISHPHNDHAGALTEILNNPKYHDLIIDKIYGSLPSQTEVLRYEPIAASDYSKFLNALRVSDRELVDLKLGEKIEIDSVNFEILGIKNPEITENFLNNSSVVIRVSDSKKSFLFTGDLGEEGGNKLLNTKRESLASEYVQMSHHGSYGVTEEFYKAVHPRFCLWPTPLWLWNNDDGKGMDSGEFQTLIVRKWMIDLGVEENYVMGDGFYQVF
jgi:beta-lactamase superfamily II metal-dependent hydrolase